MELPNLEGLALDGWRTLGLGIHRVLEQLYGGGWTLGFWLRRKPAYRPSSVSAEPQLKGKGRQWSVISIGGLLYILLGLRLNTGSTR